MMRSKLSALLSLLMVFLSGGVLGAVAYRLYYTPSVAPAGPGGAPPKKMSPEEFRRNYSAALAKEVKLDAGQVRQLNQILDETHTEFEKLRAKSKPDYDALNKERDALNEKWRPEREAIQNHQVDRINAMLSEEQKPLYTAWRAERERQRKVREAQQPQRK
jgi:uncharacterized membrane protein